MITKILSGRIPAKIINQSLTSKINELIRNNYHPKLAIILVDDNPSKNNYVKQKLIKSKELNIQCQLFTFSSKTSEKKIINQIEKINKDSTIHGIICQLPLPPNINPITIASTISPIKDVDCLNPINFGNLALENPLVTPCTPSAILHLLKYYNYSVSGKNTLIIGRSNIVGKPLSLMLLSKKNNSTVLIAHSNSEGIENLTSIADIIIVAVGKNNLLQQQPLKKTAIIIDVGINNIIDNDNKKYLTGDVDFNYLNGKVAAISPVPGGVGPLTVAFLMKNVVKTCYKQFTTFQNHIF